jgi:hypothetical protein
LEGFSGCCYEQRALHFFNPILYFDLAIMGSKAFVKLFGLDKPVLRDTVGVADTMEPPQPSESTCNACGGLNTCEAYPRCSDLHTPTPTPVRRIGFTEYPMRYLPHTLITSNLGCWYHTFRLQFNHLLVENPSIAVFSIKQSAPIPSPWHDKRHQICLFPITRLFCNAKVVVGSRWQYEVSENAIRYWDAEDGVMLVDWHILYSSYFARAKTMKNRKKVSRIVERYRRLEETSLRTKTGGKWKSYGDWGIFPATREEVARVCKYEGHGFENGLDKKSMLSAQELKVRLGDLVRVVKGAVWRRWETKRSKLGQQTEKLEPNGGCGTAVMPGYMRLR